MSARTRNFGPLLSGLFPLFQLCLDVMAVEEETPETWRPNRRDLPPRYQVPPGPARNTVLTFGCCEAKQPAVSSGIRL